VRHQECPWLATAAIAIQRVLKFAADGTLLCTSLPGLVATATTMANFGSHTTLGSGKMVPCVLLMRCASGCKGPCRDSQVLTAAASQDSSVPPASGPRSGYAEVKGLKSLGLPA
jgi:hypothetical protein